MVVYLSAVVETGTAKMSDELLLARTNSGLEIQNGSTAVIYSSQRRKWSSNDELLALIGLVETLNSDCPVPFLASSKMSCIFSIDVIRISALPAVHGTRLPV